MESHPPGQGAPPERSEPCARLIADTAMRLQPRSREIADRLIGIVLQRMDEFSGHPELADDLYTAGRVNVAHVLESLHSWDAPHEMVPTSDLFEWARALVARGLSFETLRRVFHLGQSEFHQIW